MNHTTGSRYHCIVYVSGKKVMQIEAIDLPTCPVIGGVSDTLEEQRYLRSTELPLQNIAPIKSKRNNLPFAFRQG